MKKMLALSIAAVLFFTASGCMQAGASHAEYYTVQEVRDMAAPGWHKTYQAYGRTIQVDIPVQVPKTDVFPALTVVPMPALSDVPITGEQGYDQGNDLIFNETGFFRLDSPSGRIKSEAAGKNRKNPPSGMDAMPIVRFFNELELNTTYAFNNASTVSDADALMKSMWEAYFPQEKITLMPHWVYAYGDMRLYDSKTGTFSGNPWPSFQAPLMVYFDQVIRGIPVLCYSMNSFSKYAGSVKKEIRGYAGATAILQGMANIGLNGMSKSLQYSLFKEQQVIEADLPLSSLDMAIAAYEQLIMAGKLRTVKSLRLGFVTWYNASMPESYTLLPTWVLEGELYKTAKDESQGSYIIPGEYGPLLVNAQTGEFIDPWNNSPDRSFNMPDIITKHKAGE